MRAKACYLVCNNRWGNISFRGQYKSIRKAVKASAGGGFAYRIFSDESMTKLLKSGLCKD